MDKRYQVFLSSTFADLQEERRIAIQTLMEIDCIPAGMELFPALDEEQFEFIKRVIDDSDYYLLIIGGRYGSLSETGISYTEMEYDYAIERGIKVIALIHGSPEKLIAEKIEMSPDARQKLDGFRARAQTGRLVKFWNDPKELSGLVATSLPKTIKMYPAVGWIRGNEATDNTDLLKQLNELRREKSNLEKQVQELQKNRNKMLDLAQGEDEVVISVKCDIVEKGEISWEQEVTWNNLFKCIGPKILDDENENIIYDTLSKYIASRKYDNFDYAQIDFTDFEKIKVQFLSLKYIYSTGIGSTNYWEITPEGKKYLLEMMSIKRKVHDKDDE